MTWAALGQAVCYNYKSACTSIENSAAQTRRDVDSWVAPVDMDDVAVVWLSVSSGGGATVTGGGLLYLGGWVSFSGVRRGIVLTPEISKLHPSDTVSV